MSSKKKILKKDIKKSYRKKKDIKKDIKKSYKVLEKNIIKRVSTPSKTLSDLKIYPTDEQLISLYSPQKELDAGNELNSMYETVAEYTENLATVFDINQAVDRAVIDIKGNPYTGNLTGNPYDNLYYFPFYDTPG